MAKKILFVLAISILGMTAGAQEMVPFSKNELVISYGVYSIPDISFEFGTFDKVYINGAFSKDSVRFDDVSSSGSIGAGYHRYLGKIVAIGFSATIDAISHSIEFDQGTSFRSSATVITVMPAINFHYIRTNLCSVYGGGSAGVAAWIYKTDYTDNSLNASGIKWTFAYQLTLIGMRVGKDIGGFLEMGCGYQGMVKAGLSLKL
jgi:hypothetical protein